MNKNTIDKGFKLVYVDFSSFAWEGGQVSDYNATSGPNSSAEGELR